MVVSSKIGLRHTFDSRIYLDGNILVYCNCNCLIII